MTKKQQKILRLKWALWEQEGIYKYLADKFDKKKGLVSKEELDTFDKAVATYFKIKEEIKQLEVPTARGTLS